jgi:predicted Zn-dependent peptidase
MKIASRVWQWTGTLATAAVLVAWGASVAQAEALRFELDNGMQVVLEANHASPMIAAMVFVKAGAKYESPQNNGVTHFLEHLLFNGTAQRSQEQLEPIIDLYGGYINAFTQKELTGYLVLMPREYIDTGLAIVADMLTGSIIPEAKVEKERGIVTEEIRKDTDNPDYQLETAFAAYNHRGTPYARTVLGSENTIATIPRAEILDYYHTYYVPNNMIALVMGDFEPGAMRRKVERYFGAAASGVLPKFPRIEYAPPAGGTLETHYLELPQARLVAAFPAPHFTSADYAPVELWVDYLNTEGQSPFLARVVEGPNAVASRASVSLSTLEEYSELDVDLTLVPGVDSARALSAMLEGLAAAARDLPDEAEMKALVTAEKADEYGLKERLHYYGIMRGPLFVVAGYDHVATRVDMLARVTRRELARAAAAYAGRPSYRALYAATPPPVEAKTETSVDRYLRREFPNGLVAIVKSNPDSRMFGASLVFKNRAAAEPAGMSGAVDFCQRLLEKGAGDLDAGLISQKLAEIGGGLSLTDNPYIPYDDFYTSPQFSFIKMHALDEFNREAITLLYTLVESPHMDSADVERVRKEILAALGMQSESTTQAARGLFEGKLFGNGPLAHNEMGSPASVGRLSASQLKDFWAAYAAPGNSILAVTTGSEPEVAMAWIERTFGSAPARRGPELASQAEPVPVKGEERVHQAMAKKQVMIKLGGPLCGPADDDAPAVSVMASILSERLQANLREKQGLAYSVGAGVGFAPAFGWWVATMGTGVDNYAVALSGIKSEIDRMQTGQPEANELLRAQNGIWGQMLTRRLARDNQSYYLALNEFLGLGYDYDLAYVERLRKVTAADVERVAKNYLSTRDFILATVGDIAAK